MLAAIRHKHPTIPIGLLMYANLVFSPGIDEFYAECARVGVDSVLVADVPVEESAPFRQAALRHNIAPIFICPPNADDDLLRQIASYGRGYTYLLSRAGVTGAENRAALPLHHLIEKLAEYNAAPPLQGFASRRRSRFRPLLTPAPPGQYPARPSSRLSSAILSSRKTCSQS